MDFTEQQKFKLRHLIDSLVKFIDVYIEKDVLSGHIPLEEYRKLQQNLNEFTDRYL